MFAPQKVITKIKTCFPANFRFFTKILYAFKGRPWKKIAGLRERSGSYGPEFQQGWYVKGLSHEMNFAFEDMHGHL